MCSIARAMILAARRVALATLVLFAFAPIAVAHAQDVTTPAPTPKKPAKKKPKKGAKPDAVAAPADTAPPPAPPPPVDTTPPPPPPAPEPTPAPPPTPAAAPEPAPNDPTEDPLKSYDFVGLRYRATVLPAAMLHLFADGGQTIVTNSFGVEFDHRKDGFSMVPWLVYTSYGTGNLLFLQKNEPEQPQYYSMVNSGLKSIAVGIDLLWSVQLSRDFAFEIGGGLSLGYIFGSLIDNWVYTNPNGPLVGANGTHYSPCASGDTFTGCNSIDHKNATTLKTGGYVEPNGIVGPVPVLLPNFYIPDVGVRYKPVQQLEVRANVGFSLTGFFFGLSGDYGIPEKKDSSAGAPAPGGDPPAKTD